MAEKSVKTRIKPKHDTEANWSQATNFIPLPGELIIYDADSTHTTPRFKVGDGTKTVANLPFADDNLAKSGHNHDDDYYTEAEIDTKLATKLDTTTKYAVSSSVGGAATSANKVNKSLTVKLNSGTTEGTDMFTFNGSATKSVNVTPSAIGTYTKSEIDSKLAAKPDNDTNTTYTFATGDNSGQIKVTPSGGSAQNVAVKDFVKISSGTLADRDAITSPVDGQIFLVLG